MVDRQDSRYPYSDDGRIAVPSDADWLDPLAVLAFLAATTACLLVPVRWRWGLLIFLVLHGCGTELGQRFVPTRSGSVRDVVLDCLGIGFGLAVSWKWFRVGPRPKV